MPLVFLGPQASMLLGMLSSPLTAAELHARVEEALLLDDDFIDTVESFASQLAGLPLGTCSARDTLRRLSDSGPKGVCRQLERLEDAGMVRRSRIEGVDDLWYRLSPADWPERP